MRPAREGGAGLVYGVLFTLFAALVAANWVAQCAGEVVALRRESARLAAQAVAEAGVALLTVSDTTKLSQPFGRGHFTATRTRTRDSLVIISRGTVRTSAGSPVTVAVRVRGRNTGAGFVQESWELMPP